MSSNRFAQAMSLSQPAAAPAETPPALWRDWAFWLAAAVVGVLLVGGKLLMHAGARTTDLDTGNYSNYAWGILHGQGFYGSVLGRHHLGEHFSPIMVLVAPLYLLRPTAYNLMILQGLAVAVGVMLVLVLASRRMEEAGFNQAVLGPQARRAKMAVGGLLLALMALYPPLLATWTTQFQPIELGFPLVIAALMLLHAPPSKWSAVLLGLVVLLLLMTRESAPLSVAGLAIYAGGALRRWRTALTLVIVAVVWPWVTMGLVMPYFRAGERWGHVRHYGIGELWDLKAVYLLTLVGGLGFLPLLGRHACWASAGAIPGVLLNLAVKREHQITFQGHYDAQICGFLLVAAAFGATWLARRLLLRRASAAAPRRWIPAAAFAVAALASAGTLWAITETPLVFRSWAEWWPEKAQRRIINQSKTFARKYADAPALAAHGTIGPHVCHRLNYRSMRVTDARRWPEWVRERVDPGTIFLVGGERYSPQDDARNMLRASGHARLIEQTPWVEVYQWPSDAPPRGTEEAERYAKEGLGAAITPLP